MLGGLPSSLGLAGRQFRGDQSRMSGCVVGMVITRGNRGCRPGMQDLADRRHILALVIKAPHGPLPACQRYVAIAADCNDVKAAPG